MRPLVRNVLRVLGGVVGLPLVAAGCYSLGVVAIYRDASLLAILYIPGGWIELWWGTGALLFAAGLWSRRTAAYRIGAFLGGGPGYLLGLTIDAQRRLPVIPLIVTLGGAALGWYVAWRIVARQRV